MVFAVQFNAFDAKNTKPPLACNARTMSIVLYRRADGARCGTP
jgi:hypothetical protein